MRTFWCENEIFTIYKFGEKTSTIYIFNSIIQLDNYFILKHCQNGQFRNKILVPNENFFDKKNELFEYLNRIYIYICHCQGHLFIY